MHGFLMFLEVIKIFCIIAAIAAVLAIFVLGAMFVLEETGWTLTRVEPKQQRLPMNEFYLKWRANRIHAAKAKIRARKEAEAMEEYWKTGFHHAFTSDGHLVGKHRQWIATIDGEVKDDVR